MKFPPEGAIVDGFEFTVRVKGRDITQHEHVYRALKAALEAAAADLPEAFIESFAWGTKEVR